MMVSTYSAGWMTLRQSQPSISLNACVLNFLHAGSPLIRNRLFHEKNDCRIQTQLTLKNISIRRYGFLRMSYCPRSTLSFLWPTVNDLLPVYPAVKDVIVFGVIDCMIDKERFVVHTCTKWNDRPNGSHITRYAMEF